MANSTSRVRCTISKVRCFLQRDVWDVEISALTWIRRVLVRTIRVFVLVLQGVRRDECMLHASSLTFMTLLSFIPVLAIALSMARSFGDPSLLRDHLKENLHEWLAAEQMVEGVAQEGMEEQPIESALELIAEDEKQEMVGTPDESMASNVLTLDRLDGMIDVAFERIEKLNFGALGGIGVGLLVWTVISMLGQVEAAFNRVWGVTKQRSIYRKFSDYLSVVVVVPLLMTAASTIPATSLLSRLATATGGTETLVAFPVRFLRGCGMMALLTMSLAFVVRFMPNAKVRFWPGLGGGFLVAIGMTLWLRICLFFQIGLAKYSAFFGSFAIVPLLLFWVYVTWIILLLGAEFSFGLQNADTVQLEGDWQRASVRTRTLLAVDLAATAARSVQEGDGLLHLSQWTKEHRVPVRLVNEVLSILVRHGMLVETSAGTGDFAVRFSVDRTTVVDVWKAVMDDGQEPSQVGIHVSGERLLGVELDEVLRKTLPVKLVDISRMREGEGARAG